MTPLQQLQLRVEKLESSNIKLGAFVETLRGDVAELTDTLEVTQEILEITEQEVSECKEELVTANCKIERQSETIAGQSETIAGQSERIRALEVIAEYCRIFHGYAKDMVKGINGARGKTVEGLLRAAGNGVDFPEK